MELSGMIKQSPSLKSIFEELSPIIEAIESGTPIEDFSEDLGPNEEVIGELNVFEKALMELMRKYASDDKKVKEVTPLTRKIAILKEIFWDNIRTRLDKENNLPSLRLRRGYKVTSEKKCDCENCEIKSTCPIRVIELLHR